MKSREFQKTLRNVNWKLFHFHVTLDRQGKENELLNLEGSKPTKRPLHTLHMDIQGPVKTVGIYGGVRDKRFKIWGSSITKI